MYTTEKENFLILPPKKTDGESITRPSKAIPPFERMKDFQTYHPIFYKKIGVFGEKKGIFGEKTRISGDFTKLKKRYKYNPFSEMFVHLGQAVRCTGF